MIKCNICNINSRKWIFYHPIVPNFNIQIDKKKDDLLKIENKSMIKDPIENRKKYETI